MEYVQKREGIFMNITIEKKYYEKHIKPAVTEDTIIYQTGERAYTVNGEFNYNLTRVGLDELNIMYEIARQTQNQSLMRQLTPIRNIRENPEITPKSLKAFMIGVYEFLRKNLIDGWLYEVYDNGIALPYLVESVVFIEAVRAYGETERERVEITLKANRGAQQRGGNLYSKKLKFNSDTIRNKTVEQSLQEWGFYKEDSELKESYTKHLNLFKSYQLKHGEQFIIEQSYYRDSEHYNRKEPVPFGSGVNDEEIINRVFSPTADPERWRELNMPQGFEEVPLHAYIYLFHLQVHKHVWVHVANMKPYEYDESLRNKLVLPETHRDLIDILVQHMDVLLEDVIKGKSGGTTILCVGKPGLGKTLTAEIYAEIMKKPLYKVQSGQLGLKSDDVEKNFEEILKRASRWGAILLMDEADVYIRKRGNDLHHNAVVAALLRTLEYFNGLLFMTTNRGDDVDDAILSRCIAVIEYKTPTPEAAKQIWKVLSTQFQVNLPDELIDRLVDTFPEVSGRDIKELLKLSARFAIAKKTSVNLEIFRQCAQFRGIKIEETI